MTNSNNTQTANSLTIDVAGFGYTYLFQILEMLEEFEDSGDNASAARAIRDWITDNASEFITDARANRDWAAIDALEAIVDGEPGEEPEQEPEQDPGEALYLAMAMQDLRTNTPVDTILTAYAQRAKENPGDEYNAGQFHGAAVMAAATIPWHGPLNTVTEAIYTEYGVTH